MTHDLTSATIQLQTRFEGQQVKPKSREFTWRASDTSSEVQVISDYYVVPASSTDLTLTFPAHADAIITIFEDPDNSGDLSVKINSDSNGNSVNSRRVISGALTALTATNASSTTARILKTYTIIPEGTVSTVASQTSVTYGTVTGPAGSTDNAIARWNGTGGTVLQDSGVLIDDSDNVTGATIKGFQTTTTSYSSSDTVASTDDVVLVDATSGDVTMTLFAASGNTGRVIHFKKTDSSSNLVYIDGAGSETIDGALDYRLVTQYDHVTVVCDGSNWHIIGRY